MKNKKFVITGGPGVGKTTVIEILKNRGFNVLDETARIIIEEEVFKDSDVLPWKDLAKFQERVFKIQLKKEEENKSEIVFLDRSIIDGYAYCTLGGVEPNKEIDKLALNRYDKVFLLERLDQYEKDDSRIEDHKFALDIHNEIEKIYRKFGYEVIKVPVLKPEERVDYILSLIK